ncbi:MAG TPA: peroxiredoxin [Methyloceanibacter sp.]
MGDDGGVDHLKPGVALPPVVLPATNGSDVCLATLPGRSVVAVYPWTGRPGHPNPPDWDNIPSAHGSTPELVGFRDLFGDFTKCGVAIFGLSRQTTDYQSEMAARLGLPFPILSDAKGRFTAALALPTFATGGENYLKRLTLVVAKGRIERVFYPVPEPELHARAVIAWLTQSPSASSSASSTE